MKLHTRRGRRGFSLTELLLVIGLIAILLTVAVPSVIYYQRELRLTELDDNARAVFVAAQNHLTALRSASAGELEIDTPTKTVGRPTKAVPAGATPSGTELKYVSTDVTGAEPGWLVLPGSIEADLAQGHYLVEFEPKSGSVYGVFFTQQGSKALDESAYEDVHQYADGGNTCRTRDGRKAFAGSAGGFYVGYYGSDGALDMDRPDAQTLPQPKLRLVNAEELRLEIETENWPTGIEASKVYASVSVSGGGATKTLVTEGAIRSGVTNTVVLDTLKTSGCNTDATQPTAGWTVVAPFAQWMENGGSYAITPGADITVTVSIFYKPGAGEGVVALPQSASVTTNSLFAARSGETVNVRYGRHLQNLNTATSHLDETITAAKQVREIDFAKTGDIPYSWAATYPDRAFTAITNANLDRYDGGGLSIRNLKVENASGNAGLFAAFAGSRLEKVTLVDAKVNGATAGALAGEIQNGSTTTLSACQVYTTKRVATPPQIWGSTFAGGLVGRASNCSIQDGSFASTVIYGSNVGGLVGRSEGGVTIANSYAAGYLTGGSNVGGLVGAGSGVTISDSYAAGTIAKATNKVGGLSTDSATVRRSYAAVEYVETPAAESVYGLVPSGSCQNAYYLVKLGVNDKVTPSGVTAVTSTGKMRKDQGLALGAAFKEGGNASVMAVPYNLPNQADGTREPTLSAPYPYPTLALDAGGSEKTDLTHYGDWLEGDALRGIVSYYEQYETPSGLQTDYFYYSLNGDGVLETKGELNATGSLYCDGYAFLSLNKLHEDDQTTVPMMVAIGKDAEMKEYTTLYLGTYVDGLITYYAYGLPNSVLDGAVAAEEYFLQLRVAGLDSSSELSSLWLNPHFGRAAYNGYGETNPGNGSPKVPVPSATVGAISIRSVRQFNNMRKYKSAIRNWVQELDMDASAYKGHRETDAEGYLTVGGLRVTARQSDGTWSPVMGTDLPSVYRLAITPITMTSPSKGLTKDTWGGTYDGQGHTISDLSIGTVTGVGANNQSRYYAGLFCCLSSSGAVKNIALSQCDVTGISGNKDAYTGALAGYTEGTITNCAVVNTSVTAVQQEGKEGGYIGGLVGFVRKGTVQNCGVRLEGGDLNALYDACLVTGAGEVGGLTGQVKEGSVECCYAAVKVSGKTAGGFAGTLTGGTVTDCYAGGHTKNGKYAADMPNVTGTEKAGGFAGTWSGGSLSGLCYTTCAVSGDKNVDVFANGKKTAPEGCYAVGDAFVGGKSATASAHNVAGVKLRPSYPGTKAVAHPYDTALAEIYYYQPITGADGALMDHYGDWCQDTNTRGNREWVQQIDKTMNKPYTNPETQMELEGDILHIKYEVEVTNGSQDVFNTGPQTNGIFCITTDLGYKLIFRATSSPKEVIGGSGAHITFERVLLDKDRNPLPIEYDGNINYVKYITWDVAVPKEDLPPYRDTVKLGAMEPYTDPENGERKERFMAEVPVPDGGVQKDSTEVTITVDGDFSDWIGYEHQVLEPLPAGEQTPLYGHTTGAVLGEVNKDGSSDIYLHVVTERPENWEELDDNQKSLVKNLWPNGWPATKPTYLKDAFPTLGQMYITAYEKGNNNAVWTPDYTFFNKVQYNAETDSTGAEDEIRGSYKLIKSDMSSWPWVETEIGQIDFYADDTRVEYELVLHLDGCVGKENAANIDKVDFLMTRAWNKHLTVKRDLDTPDP